jgi:hypothetical protein
VARGLVEAGFCCPRLTSYIGLLMRNGHVEKINLIFPPLLHFTGIELYSERQLSCAKGCGHRPGGTGLVRLSTSEKFSSVVSSLFSSLLFSHPFTEQAGSSGDDPGFYSEAPGSNIGQDT